MEEYGGICAINPDSWHVPGATLLPFQAWTSSQRDLLVFQVHHRPHNTTAFTVHPTDTVPPNEAQELSWDDYVELITAQDTDIPPTVVTLL